MIRETAQFPVLSNPCVNDKFNFFQSHRREREIVTRREADYAANSGLRLGNQQAHAISIETSMGDLRLQGREVVLENKGC